MKKLIVMMGLGLLLSVGVVGNSQAQISLPEIKITSPKDVPDKVTEAFQSTFKDAKAPKWYHPNKNYVVTFIMDDIKHNALFTKNGYMVYHISYGNENTIPEDMKSAVKNKFSNYDIIAVINVQQNGRNVWFITGEGKQDFMNVSIDEGVMSEEKKYKKYM